NLDLELKNISKIEGHTHMRIKARDGKVSECKLRISENKRFFTDAVVGLSYDKISMTMSRICGTCSSAHVLCSIEAIEKAFDVKVSAQTMRLRNLLINASHLRDHAMHLYFFVLPDVFGVDSVLDFGEDKHEWIHRGLDIKAAGNFLATIIGGRAIHPPAAVVGGFTQIPKTEEIAEAVKKLSDVREKVLAIIELLFSKREDWTFENKTNYVGLVNDDYNFLEGRLKTSNGTEIEEADFGEHLERVVLPYSNASAFEFESEEYSTGALARMNVNKDKLNSRTAKDVAKYIGVFPSANVFDNNLAQAIECLNIIDNCVEDLGDPFSEEKPVRWKVEGGRLRDEVRTGVGVIEAPRGTLYYRLDFDSKGVVTFCDLVIPTQQNIFHMEKSIGKYVESLLAKGLDKDKISFEVEKMIRAYDPCMSCAAHFLEIDWE
ncbi:MAG: nickel-dependent hydrogenase large subunit, partial [Nanoarchaeota archaeon]|nr:nickel-dependent hydrogenase large subunit [Nanoarchaeota archaeon]